MPAANHSAVIREMADELFQIQTLFATSRSRSRVRGAADLSESEFLALDLLERSEKMSVGGIQKQIGVLPAQMSRIVRSLENRPDEPLIKCQMNRKDKRKVDIEITRAGRIAYKNYRQIRLDAMENFIGTLSDKDCREFMRICRIIRGQIETLLMSRAAKP